MRGNFSHLGAFDHELSESEVREMEEERDAKDKVEEILQQMKQRHLQGGWVFSGLGKRFTGKKVRVDDEKVTLPEGNAYQIFYESEMAAGEQISYKKALNNIVAICLNDSGPNCHFLGGLVFSKKEMQAKEKEAKASIESMLKLMKEFKWEGKATKKVTINNEQVSIPSGKIYDIFVLAEKVRNKQMRHYEAFNLIQDICKEITKATPNRDFYLALLPKIEQEIIMTMPELTQTDLVMHFKKCAEISIASLVGIKAQFDEIKSALRNDTLSALDLEAKELAMTKALIHTTEEMKLVVKTKINAILKRKVELDLNSGKKNKEELAKIEAELEKTMGLLTKEKNLSQEVVKIVAQQEEARMRTRIIKEALEKMEARMEILSRQLMNMMAAPTKTEMNLYRESLTKMLEALGEDAKKISGFVGVHSAIADKIQFAMDTAKNHLDRFYELQNQVRGSMDEQYNKLYYEVFSAIYSYVLPPGIGAVATPIAGSSITQMLVLADNIRYGLSWEYDQQYFQKDSTTKERVGEAINNKIEKEKRTIQVLFVAGMIVATNPALFCAALAGVSGYIAMRDIIRAIKLGYDQYVKTNEVHARLDQHEKAIAEFFAPSMKVDLTNATTTLRIMSEVDTSKFMAAEVVQMIKQFQAASAEILRTVKDEKAVYTVEEKPGFVELESERETAAVPATPKVTVPEAPSPPRLSVTLERMQSQVQSTQEEDKTPKLNSPRS